MNKLTLFACLSAFAAGATHAQQTAPPAEPPADEAATPDRRAAAPSATPGTTTPLPATRQTEGTAADRTPPGATATRPTEPGTVNPVPATSPTEGTAADRSPPGETPVRGTAASEAPEEVTSRMAAAGPSRGQQRGSQLIGMQVRDEQGNSLGEIEDLVINPTTGRVTHAIVDRGGMGAQDLTAVPWSSMQSAMHAGSVVLDRTRLSEAPAVKQGEWSRSNTWQSETDRYWGGGGSGREY